MYYYTCTPSVYARADIQIPLHFQPPQTRRLGFHLLPPSGAGPTTTSNDAGDLVALEGTPRRASTSALYPNTPKRTPRDEEQQQAQSLGSVEISRKVKACAACRKQKVSTSPSPIITCWTRRHA